MPQINDGTDDGDTLIVETVQLFVCTTTMVFSPLICFVPQTNYNHVALPAAITFDKQWLDSCPPSPCGRLSQRLYSDTRTEADLELLPSIRDSIQESGDDDTLSNWKECVELVSSKSGLSPELSELALATANGWKAWVKVKSKFAKKYMKTHKPDQKNLEAALDWSLSSPLRFSQDQLSSAINDSPDVYLLDPAANYEKALSAAPKRYQEPEIFIALALADPTVLACTFNCVDYGCNSECGNCWVSYENRKNTRLATW